MQKKIKSIESLFSISRDLAIGVYEGKIAFINPAAAAVFPTIQAGADARLLLPKELLDSGDEPRVISAHICGRPCTVSVSSMDGVQLMLAVISPVRTIRDRENTIVPPPLVTAMRIALSNIRLSGECFMKISDEPGSDAYRKQTQRYMAFLSHNCHQLQRIIVGIDTINNLGNGSLPFTPCITDIVTLVRELCESADHFVLDTGVHIVFTCGEDKLLANIDTQLIEQLVLNLLCNGITAEPKDSTVHVSLRFDQPNVILTVADNGSGIDAGTLSSIFKYHETPRNLRNSLTRAGLGLTIVRGIAELHGGTVTIESQPGNGTCVQVSLPQNAGSPSTALFREPRPRFRAAGAELLLTELSPVLDANYYEPRYAD